MSHSTVSAARSQKRKLGPLWLHSHSRRWAKKIKNKVVYFGYEDDDDDDVIYRYEYYKRNGKLPPADETEEPADETEEASSKIRLGELIRKCLDDKSERVASGERSRRTVIDYEATWNLMADVLGRDAIVENLGPDEFGRLRKVIAERRSLNGLRSFIIKCRVLFRWAVKNEIIDRVRFGTRFDLPSEEDGDKTFSPKEIHELLEIASPQLRAIILCGINLAYGNHDISCVPISAFDFENKVATFPRPKTGVYRKGYLWDETIEALEAWLPLRPAPSNPEHEDRMFLTSNGTTWTADTHNALGREFARLIDKLDLNGRVELKTVEERLKRGEAVEKEPKDIPVRKNRGFYGLRHSHQTAAADKAGAEDLMSIALVMGHKLGYIGDKYTGRKQVDSGNEGIKAVADKVHKWLFGPDNNGNNAE